MQYQFNEIHTLNLLSDEQDYSRHFHTPLDLKIMVMVILLCFAGAITGALLFKVDKIVPAQGVIDTKAELFEIRNTEPGFIEKMMVKEGEFVHKGQLLVQFDTELADLDIDGLRQQLNNLARNIWTNYYQIHTLLDQKTKSQLRAELTEVPDPVALLGYGNYLSKPFMDAREVNLQSQKGLQAQFESSQRQQNNLQQRLVLQRAELSRTERLYKEQIESKATLDEVKAEVLTIEAEMESLTETIQSLQTERTKLVKEQNQSESEYILKRLLDIHDQLDSFQRTSIQLAQAQRNRRDLSIISPIEGTVDALFIQGDKERIPETSTLLTIRPGYDEQDLKIDIQIPSSYAIWVQPGMEFRASSQGNNPEDHGYVIGNITFIAASSEVDSKSSERMYRMTGKIREIKALHSVARETLLRPGSVLSVEIRSGKRRLINYLFDPFTKYLRTALSEPS